MIKSCNELDISGNAMAREGWEVIWPGVEGKTGLSVHQEDKLDAGITRFFPKTKGVL